MLSAMTTVFGSAMLCRRAARLGVSPTTACSCADPVPIRSPTTTKPVATSNASLKRLTAFNAPTAAISSSPARTLVREAAEETGLIERVPVLDKEGKPTGRYEFRYGAEGEKGYLKWVARNHPGHFMALYGKLIPLDVNAKVEEKPVVRYETVEERRAAMLAKGWHPSALAALEEAMEPKFLRDMREKERKRKESEGQLIEGSPENDGQGEAN